MGDPPTHYRMQLPFGSAEQFAKHGPSWTDLWIRDGTSDVDVLREVWIEDTYRVRSIDLRGALTDRLLLSNPPREERTPTTVIDLGACTGVFSALCLAFGASHVIAVEPEPANVELLRRNVANARVEIIEAAVGAERGKAMLHGDGATGHTSHDADAAGIVVDVVTLESIIERVNGPVALLKCDVEGAEYDAVCACPHDVLARVDRIAMEWHGPLETPWVGQARIGELVEHLQYTHSCSVIGTPDKGGYLYAHRNDL